MITDAITFNGEYELLEIRLNILNDVVDQFIIVEAPTTFSGKQKPLYFKEKQGRYAPWAHKIKYFVIDENYTEKEIKQATESPNTKGADHWKHEFLQKESIKKALTYLKDDDIVFVGDVDEIWDKTCLNIYKGINPVKLKLKVYAYYFNNRSDELFWGPIMTDYKTIKNSCLNHLRTDESIYRTLTDNGWHFTSLKDILRRKLEDSYTEDSYATPWVMQNLENNIENNKDFLGRNFTYFTDESDLPIFLKENKERYAHLFR